MSASRTCSRTSSSFSHRSRCSSPDARARKSTSLRTPSKSATSCRGSVPRWPASRPAIEQHGDQGHEDHVDRRGARRQRHGWSMRSRRRACRRRLPVPAPAPAPRAARRASGSRARRQWLLPGVDWLLDAPGAMTLIAPGQTMLTPFPPLPALEPVTAIAPMAVDFPMLAPLPGQIRWDRRADGDRFPDDRPAARSVHDRAVANCHCHHCRRSSRLIFDLLPGTGADTPRPARPASRIVSWKQISGA